MKRTLALLVLLALLAGCGGAEPTATPDAVATQIAVEKAAHATMTAEAGGSLEEAPAATEVEQATAAMQSPTDAAIPPTDTAVPPTDTAIPPTDTPEPTVGMSRSHPFPYSEVASALGWDIQVVEMVRGTDAWQTIKAANQFNEPAPEGMEYLLLRLHLKCTYDDSEEHDISEGDFKITGDRYVRYSSPSIVPPEPELDATMLSGGETEGWGVYLVAQGEGNLILILEEMFSFDASPTFIALEEGASVAVPSELADIEPTDLGVARESPAPFDTMVTTEDWEVTAIDMLRGGDAWVVVLDANQFNDPPAEGMEYTLVKIRARYIGAEDNYESIDGYSLKSSGEKKVIYDLPSIVDPDPQFDCALYPGGVCEGWVTLQAAVDEAGLMAIFEPPWDFGDENTRFLSLATQSSSPVLAETTWERFVSEEFGFAFEYPANLEVKQRAETGWQITDTEDSRLMIFSVMDELSDDWSSMPLEMLAELITSLLLEQHDYSIDDYELVSASTVDDYGIPALAARYDAKDNPMVTKMLVVRSADRLWSFWLVGASLDGWFEQVESSLSFD